MLETIWFVLWGLLWAIYFMLDGFDLGIGTLMPFMAKNEEDKRLMYRSMTEMMCGLLPLVASHLPRFLSPIRSCSVRSTVH